VSKKEKFTQNPRRKGPMKKGDKCARGESKTSGGFIWKYKNK